MVFGVIERESGRCRLRGGQSISPSAEMDPHMPETHQSPKLKNPLLSCGSHPLLVLVHIENENCVIFISYCPSHSSSALNIQALLMCLWVFIVFFYVCNFTALLVLISKRRTILPSHLTVGLENDMFSALRVGSEQLAVNKAKDHRLTERLAGKINKYWHSLFFPSVHPMRQKSVK